MISAFFLILGFFFDKEIAVFLSRHTNAFLTGVMGWFSFFGTWFMVLIFLTSLFLWHKKKKNFIIPLWIANILFFSIGICTGAEILCFIAATTIFEPAVAGTMTGFLNGVVSLFAAIVQQNVGVVLDYFWDGSLTAEGLRSYSIYTYQVAFGFILFITCLSVSFSGKI